MELKELEDTDVSTEISDFNSDEFQHSSDRIKMEQKQSIPNTTSNGSEFSELSDERRKTNIPVDPTKFKGYPPRNIQEMLMESPQAPLWPGPSRQCSTPEAGIVSDPNLFFNTQPDIRVEVDEFENIQHVKREKELSGSSSFDYENIQKIADELGSAKRKLECLLKFSERSHTPKMNPTFDEIGFYSKKINTVLENVSHDVKLDQSSIDKENSSLTYPLKHSTDKRRQQNDEPNSGCSKKDEVSNDQLKMRNQVKTFFEKYYCTLAFTLDEKKDQLLSVSVEKMNRISDNRGDFVPGSSGSLADHSSISDSNSVYSLRKLPFHLPARHSISESSSTSSALSVHQRHSHHFLPPDKFTNRSKNCVCKCFCSLLKSSQPKASISATADLMMSSIENSKAELSNSKEIPQNTEEFVKGIACSSSEGILSVGKKNADLAENDLDVLKTPDVIAENKKGTSDLLVFGRWRNKYYPGKIEGVTLEDWHDSDQPLKVLFYDGLPKLLANVFIIPATMLPPNMDIMCPVGDNLYEEGILIKTEKVTNENSQESLNFIINIDNDVVTAPFEKVWFKEITKKQLGITPRKPKITPLGMPWLILSGKRQRPSSSNVTIKKQSSTSLTIEKSAKKLKASSTKLCPISVINLDVAEESESQSSKGLKRVKSSSDEELQKNKKYIKKLEFEPEPSTSSAFIETTVEKRSDNKSSETDWSDFHKEDYIDVSGLDYEYLQINHSFKKSLEFDKIKSFPKVLHKDQEEDNILGPIRKSTIFKGYNFVLTHSHRDSSKLLTSKSTKSSKETRSSSEMETDTTTDLEDQVRNCPNFDYVRLKMQIKAGGGLIYDSIAEINSAEYAHTITVSDYPCQTPNYLLSLALGIPIYRHDLIINSCKENIPVSRMIKQSFYMPTGQSLETGAMIERTKIKSKKPLKGWVCAINISFPKFWQTMLKAMGANVLSISRNLTGCSRNINFILADKNISVENCVLAEKEHIPILTRSWVIQTLIHGELQKISSEFIVTPQAFQRY